MVAGHASQRHALGTDLPGSVDCADRQEQRCKLQQGLGANVRRGGCPTGERGAQRLDPFGDLTAMEPVVRERGGETQLADRISGLGQIAKRGAEVGVFDDEAIQVMPHLRAIDVGPDLFGEGQEKACVPVANRIGGPRPFELLGGKFTNCLQHREACVLARTFDPAQQALLDKCAKLCGHVRGWPACNGAGGVPVEPVDAHREAAEQRLFLGSEKVVTPGDRIRHRLLPVRQVARRVPGRAHPVRKLREQICWRQQCRPCCRQFDREGQAVEALADAGDRLQVVVSVGERRVNGPGALDEELARGGLVQHARLVVGWQRVYRQSLLAPDPERNPARREDVQVGATRGEVGDAWCCCDDLFHVVQYQQELARPQERSD